MQVKMLNVLIIVEFILLNIIILVDIIIDKILFVYLLGSGISFSSKDYTINFLPLYVIIFIIIIFTFIILRHKNKKDL